MANQLKKTRTITDKITVKGKLSDQEQNQDKFPIDSATIIIELPFEVTDNNADNITGTIYILYSINIHQMAHQYCILLILILTLCM